MIKFIDLFAGIGGMRLGFEYACKRLDIQSKCVFSSEIKNSANQVYKDNFNETPHGDISEININEIPNFDFLLAGFPCQTFSTAGKRKGFSDNRGTLFFEIEKILKSHQPSGFILENVDNLEKHDNGNTFKVIRDSLSNLNYNLCWFTINSKDFGIPQERKRLYILGLKGKKLEEIAFSSSIPNTKKLKDILEKDKPLLNNEFTQKLLKYFSLNDLKGKLIKDTRGGQNNIHSWDICLRGEITQEQKDILNLLFKIRRYKRWSKLKGIKWMDGMPLTLEEITIYYTEHPNLAFPKNLKSLLDDLVDKRYLKLEHPKDIIENKRQPRKDLQKSP